MHNWKTWTLTVGLGLSLAACSNDQASDLPGTNQGQNTSQDLVLKLNGLEPTVGQHYEGWAIGADGVTSTGRFNIDSSGQIVAVDSDGDVVSVLSSGDTATFSANQDMAGVTSFVLTIEPNGDRDSGPSPVQYLAGDVSNGVGLAVVDDVAALGVSFFGALGRYLLATPSNGPATHNQGIWYIDSGMAGLTLPALNGTFAYEGWIVNTSTGEVVSTGVFAKADEEDSDAGGPTAGPNPTPAFPGQDFINPPMILNDGNHVAVISVEPVPDFDPAPFTIKILRAEIANGAAVTTPFDMQNITNEADISIEISRP